jgi:hypothetical protein
MQTLTNKKLILFFLLTLQASGIILSQQRTLIGVNLTSNYDTYTTIKPEIGLVFERQVTVHSGMEIGFNYRTYQREFLLLINNQTYYPLIAEKYFSIPISYKFYSKIVNVGFGLTLDYNLGWKQINSTLDLISYTPDYDYYAGMIAKISKQIHLGDDFLLEPEIKVNILVIPFERSYIGFGLVAKFDLHKD